MPQLGIFTVQRSLCGNRGQSDLTRCWNSQIVRTYAAHSHPFQMWICQEKELCWTTRQMAALPPFPSLRSKWMFVLPGTAEAAEPCLFRKTFAKHLQEQTCHITRFHQT